MYVAFISAPENLKKLVLYRQIGARLALGQASAEEARALAEEGRAVVWIDSGLHASEVAPAQQAPLLAYKMLTDDSAEVEMVRRNVILMQVPVINPDGHDRALVPAERGHALRNRAHAVALPEVCRAR
jgi:murein tripeptide amidase MpaA